MHYCQSTHNTCCHYLLLKLKDQQAVPLKNTLPGCIFQSFIFCSINVREQEDTSVATLKSSETAQQKTLFRRSKNVGKYPDLFLLPAVNVVGLPYIIQKTLSRPIF